MELDEPGRRAAVLLVLYDRAQRPHLLLTKRTDTVPSHPGQISLPGGVAEPGDGSLERTALRETEEEVGLTSSRLRVVAELDDVATMVSGFIVRPFVAVAEGPLRRAERRRGGPDPGGTAERAPAGRRRPARGRGAPRAAVPARRRGRVGGDGTHPA